VAVFSDPFEVDTFGPYNGTVASGDAVVTHEELFGESRLPGVLENYLVTWDVSLDATLLPGTYYATFFSVGGDSWEFQETDINLGNDWYYQENGAGVFQIDQFDTNTFAVDIGMTAVPSPGSLALLGPAFLTALRRRRRA